MKQLSIGGTRPSASFSSVVDKIALSNSKTTAHGHDRRGPGFLAERDVELGCMSLDHMVQGRALPLGQIDHTVALPTKDGQRKADDRSIESPGPSLVVTVTPAASWVRTSTLSLRRTRAPSSAAIASGRLWLPPAIRQLGWGSIDAIWPSAEALTSRASAAAAEISMRALSASANRPSPTPPADRLPRRVRPRAHDRARIATHPGRPR